MVKRYLFTNFLSSFASLFGTLFMIMSIVFFLQIARITAVISINFIELLKLYLFMLPQILLFTMPISFFVSLAIVLFKLSKENESIVLFTLAYSPKKIALFFCLISTILSFFLLLMTFLFIPLSENLNKNFINHKKTTATLNIKAKEFGQKIGDWFIFIENIQETENKTIYENITMFLPRTKKESEKLITAKSGNFDIENFKFILNNGKINTQTNDFLHIGEFKKLILNIDLKSNLNEDNNILSYWKNMSEKRKKDFSIFVLVSLFPLASVLFAISFGLVVYRYEKGVIYFGIFAVLFSYFALIMFLAKYPQIAILSIFSLCFLTSFLYFKKTILNKF